MLERGIAARAAASVFYESFNDVDIYVEDTAIGYEKIFAKLLGRATDGIISIDRVFPLGPRSNVMDEAKKYLHDNVERKSIFIVDGDLYLLCGEFEEKPENVISLSRYCIENFLFDERALLEILDEECYDKDLSVLKTSFNYEKWLEEAGAALNSLFVIFAVAHFTRSGIKTVKRGIKNICKDEYGNIDHEKTRLAYEEIYDELVDQFGLVVVEYVINIVRENIDAGKCFVSTYVSGKDFILPLLFIRLKRFSGSKSSNINLKTRLANKCDVEPLMSVANCLKAYRR